MKTNYDRFAKNLWIKVFQQIIDKGEHFDIASQIADVAVKKYADFFEGKHTSSDLQKNTQNMHEGLIEVPFGLDDSNDVWFGDNEKTSIVAFWNYCRKNNIDQTRIKRILLEMKSENEE